MNSIFVKLFSFFIIALLISMLIISILIIASFNHSFYKIKQYRFYTIKMSIYYLIKDYFRYKDPSLKLLKYKLIDILPENVVVTFYKNDSFTITEKIFLKLNINNYTPITSELLPVYYNNNLIYYYSVSYYDVVEKGIFQYLFSEMKHTLLYSIIISFIVSIIISLFFTINLSNHAKKISKGLNIIAEGNFNINLEEDGSKEFLLISKSANILAKKLKYEQELKNQWMQDITHDLRTPITALKTQLEGIKDGVLDFSITRIDKNLSELKRMEDLINDLADLTILESKEIEIIKEDFNINSVINEIKTSFLSLMYKKNIDFKYDSNITLLNGDKKFLTRALTNLIDNAIKFTNDNGSIKINIIKNIKSIVISIFNSGSYIKPEEYDRIFDRLYRCEYARNTNGTGLGLTIAKKIINLHDGIIKVESKYNHGTTFIIVI